MERKIKVSYVFLVVTLLLAIVNYVIIGSVPMQSINSSTFTSWTTIGFLNASVILLVLFPVIGLGSAYKGSRSKYRKWLLIGHGICICTISSYACYIGYLHVSALFSS
ncbi:hypothetical protein [Bacillus sp. 1P06AnD]|uniref:hypothetical protein n=1 Tax=Bacillus sp. 1P06AnD TaxID=3132208 RepID=UPI00399F3C37